VSAYTGGKSVGQRSGKRGAVFQGSPDSLKEKTGGKNTWNCIITQPTNFTKG
jgi:hypothetical protein